MDKANEKGEREKHLKLTKKKKKKLRFKIPERVDPETIKVTTQKKC